MPTHPSTAGERFLLRDTSPTRRLTLCEKYPEGVGEETDHF